ncbi:hypothetical protein RIEPE_0368 [Candidatus Riesia pediculicola USDA]|uniref:Uncharacterized protein n=1 Tax=Riesia pediculicola (strain USDA) TaxID=515618 RepID=D4G8F6_RIEPU|nr:hypothetical protein RIEPE_0368 [Candidatus Riesia pediculicola USDA]
MIQFAHKSISILENRMFFQANKYVIVKVIKINILTHFHKSEHILLLKKIFNVL